MIRTLTIRVNAANPELPLERSVVYQGSALSLVVLGVPAAVGKLAVTGLTIAITNVDGETVAVQATRVGKAFAATVPADSVGGPGTSLDGLVISATGTDEKGTPAAWIVGVGDIEVNSLDAVPTPGVTRQIVHAYHAAPTVPHFSDIAPVGGVLSYYDGTAWISLESSEPADYATVRINASQGASHAAATGNPHEANGRQIPIEAGSDQTVTGAIEYYASDVRDHINDSNNPHGTTAEQVGTYTAAEIDDKIGRAEAHYLTADAAGNAFATAAALKSATAFYYAGQLHTPDKNDYLTVLSDEDHPTAAGLNPTTRYAFVGTYAQGGSFVYQYTINDTTLTQAQLAALNSGATADKIAAIDGKLDKTGGEIDGDLAVTGDLTKDDRPVATTDQLDYALVQSTVASRSIVDVPDAGTSGAAITVPAGFRDLILCTHGKVASISFADTGLSPFGDDLPTEGDNLVTITRLPLNRVFVRVISMESKTYGN